MYLLISSPNRVSGSSPALVQRKRSRTSSLCLLRARAVHSLRVPLTVSVVRLHPDFGQVSDYFLQIPHPSRYKIHHASRPSGVGNESSVKPLRVLSGHDRMRVGHMVALALVGANAVVTDDVAAAIGLPRAAPGGAPWKFRRGGNVYRWVRRVPDAPKHSPPM